MTSLSPIDYSDAMMIAEFGDAIREVHQENKQLKATIDIPKKEGPKLVSMIKAGGSARLPFIILGKSDLRVDQEYVNNFGTTAVNPQHNQKTIMDFFKKIHPGIAQKALKEEVTEHLTGGSILNDANWYPFKNDCFIYGAIRKNKEFHLGILHSGMKEEFLWDSDRNRPTVLGREIIMVMQSGYQMHNTKYGMILMPPCKGSVDSQDATVSRYRDGIKQIKSGKEILKLLG